MFTAGTLLYILILTATQVTDQQGEWHFVYFLHENRFVYLTQLTIYPFLHSLGLMSKERATPGT